MPRKLEKSSQNLSHLMARYFMESHRDAHQGKFVVWIAIVVPTELLHGFDLVISVPENHSAVCAAKGAGARQAHKAESRGYSIDLCSYARIDLGTWFDRGSGSPTMGLPKPDLLISNNNNCSHLVKWFDVYHREYGIPHFVLDIPFCYQPQKEKDTRYILAQFGDLIRTIENLSGQKFDPDKVHRAVEHSAEAIRHWRRLLDLATHRPSGITAFDTFLHMGPFLTSFRGTPEIVQHCKLLADEAEQRLQSGDFPVPNEKVRLLWDNIAPWHQLRKMSTRLTGLGANINCATYTSNIGTIEGGDDQPEYSGRDPLWHLARAQNATVCPYGLELRHRAMSRLIEKNQVDAVVFASNRSCKVYSLMQMDLQKRIQKSHGIPTTMIDVDHADVRKYNEDGVFTRLEALLEGIQTSRRSTNPSCP